MFLGPLRMTRTLEKASLPSDLMITRELSCKQNTGFRTTTRTRASVRWQGLGLVCIAEVAHVIPIRMHIDHEGVVLETESDVEMKIIVPLLQGAAYLDIPESSVKTKKYLAPTPFNKKAGQTAETILISASGSGAFHVLSLRQRLPKWRPRLDTMKVRCTPHFSTGTIRQA